MTRAIVHADHVLPGDGAAIADGAVVVEADGTIVELGDAAGVIARHAGLAVERVRGALAPGLVNAHTHLELSALRGKVPGGAGFVAWVQKLLPTRSELRADDDLDAIGAAVDELARAGTAAVGEVTNSLHAVRSLARAGIGGIVFHELFALERDGILAKVAALEAAMPELLATWPAGDLAYAPAPHTLYTTHPDGVRALVSLARARGARTSVHLAEHAAERAFLRDGAGPFAALVGADHPAIRGFPVPHADPITTAASLGVLAPDVLAVHLADARKDELARVAEAGMPVVVCPRSNLFIEVRLPPLLDMLAAGIVPALGTDSLASNTSLDVLAEARALADRFPGVPARTLFEMATAAGARALARSDLGRIAPGTRPGLLALDGSVAGDPFAWAIRQPVGVRRWVRRRTTGAAS